MVINTKYSIGDNVIYQNTIYKVILIEVTVIDSEQDIYYNIVNDDKGVITVLEDEMSPLPS